MDNGAHFHKTDLQVHSPRDLGWKGPRPNSDEERATYAASFVKACREAGLAAVAVTDHHDTVFIDPIRKAAAEEIGPDGKAIAEADRLVVFPGIELTLSVPCQALLILDPDFPQDRVSEVLTLLSVTQADESSPKANEPSAIVVTGLQDLHDRLDRSSWLKGRYIVLPHVSDGGHQTIIRKGMKQHYIDMPCIGGYTDGPVSKLGDGNLNILAGKAAEWGNKRLAVVQTSDARTSDFSHVGEHATWIKWAKPSAEALRQAFLAQESRLTNDSPELPELVVTRLKVSNSKFMGPIDLELNPQYNALIGGRGTGKSTCLEYLRWALCDQPARAQGDDEIPDHATRRERLIAQTLEPLDANVEAHVEINGISHVVQRYAKSKEVWIQVSDGERELTTPDDVRALLPLQAYSQKQLSSVGVRTEELRRFVTAPIRERLDALDSDRDGVAANIRENFVVLQRHRALVRSTARDELVVRSIDEQATRLRKELAGINEADKAVLEGRPGFDAGQARADAWAERANRIKKAAEAFSDVVAAVADEFPVNPDHSSVSERALIEQLESAIKGELSTVQSDAASALGSAEAMVQVATDGDAANAWAAKQKAFTEKYDAAVKRSTAHKSKLDQLAQLDARRKTVQQELEKARSELKQLENASAEHDRLRSEWRQLEIQRTDAIDDQCRALTQSSDGLIRASISTKAGVAPLIERLKAAVSGSNVRSTKIEDFASRIAGAEKPHEALHDAMDDLESAVLAKSDPAAQPKSPESALGVFSDQDIAKMAERLTPEAVLDLSLTALDDLPEFAYRTRAGEYINFDDASAGQQATALLGALLSQPGPPLVIDQPEDDLDSQVVLEIVDKIWSAKRTRQLIFTSHNANLVVNGDAELVICCDYRSAGDQSGGRIKLQGAIDIPELRKEISLIMEGGEKAFRLRKEKYGF